MTLEVINTEMQNIDIPYEYMRWTSKVDGRYWVGEYTEMATLTEDGYKEATFILTGFTRNTWAELEADKAKIEKHFSAVYGLRKSTDTGSIAIYYDTGFPVPTGEDELKRIQINLRVKEWRFNQ